MKGDDAKAAPTAERRYGLRQGIGQGRQFLIHRYAKGLKDACCGMDAGWPGGPRNGVSYEVGQMACARDG